MKYFDYVNKNTDTTSYNKNSPATSTGQGVFASAIWGRNERSLHRLMHRMVSHSHAHLTCFFYYGFYWQVLNN